MIRDLTIIPYPFIFCLDFVISQDWSFVRLLLDIGNVALFLGLDDLRDRTFDVLFSLPINPVYQQILSNCLQSREGVGKLADLLKISISELNIPRSLDKALEDLEFVNVTQQLYLLQVRSLTPKAFY